MRRSVIAAALAALFLISFSNEVDAQRRPVRRPVKKPVPAASGAVRTPSGLTYLITQRGTGRLPKKGDTVLVNYTGMFTSGVKFDSSLDPGRTPIAFPLGEGRVIKGWDEGIGKLRIGDRAIFVIPPALAYGEAGAGNGAIPPNSTLVFLVELMDIKTMTMSKVLSQALASGGVPAMIARHRELKQKGLGDIYASEEDINALGYQALGRKKYDEAIAIFKLNVEDFPGSANVHDSLGEAYAEAGQKQLAIESYERALVIDPKFTSAIDALDKLKSGK